jgi:hypothetical protein
MQPRSYRLAIFAVALSAIAFTQNWIVPADPTWDPNAPRLYRVKSAEGKVGFIDSSATLVIPHRFDYAADFHEGLAYFTAGKRCGYINIHGEVVFEIGCTMIHFDFHEGLAGFEVPSNQKSKKYVYRRQRGFINKEGKIAIAPRFNWVEDFSEGLAAATDKYMGKWGYIDKSGQYVIPPTFDYAASFSEGLAAVQVGKKVGYIDHTGAFVIPLRFEEHGGGFFRCGVALASMGDDKMGTIDRTGNWVIPPRHSTGWGCTEGLIPFTGNGAALRYYDTKGSVVIESKYSGFRQFSQGLAPVSLDYKWGYINTKGEIVLPLQYADAFPFEGGLALVNVNAEWVYIDRTGRIVWHSAYY